MTPMQRISYNREQDGQRSLFTRQRWTSQKEHFRMHQPDWQAFQERLIFMRDEYQTQIQDLTLIEEAFSSSNQAIPGIASLDPSDEADTLFDAEMNLAQITNLRGILDLIESALARIDAGGYGICQECGNPIDQKRLSTIPYALFCLDDQIIHEQNPA
jgi:DnaK suppressor protein